MSGLETNLKTPRDPTSPRDQDQDRQHKVDTETTKKSVSRPSHWSRYSLLYNDVKNYYIYF